MMVSIEQQQANLQVLYDELDWLSRVINQVVCSYLKQEGHENHWQDIVAPDLTQSSTVYADLVSNWQLNSFERIAMALAMAPQLKPEVLDIFFGVNQLIDRSFTEFGGSVDKSLHGFVPTGQTLIFILTANDPLWRIEAIDVLSSQHKLMAEQVISLHHESSSDLALNSALLFSEQWLSYLMTGEKVKTEQTANFPAHAISTPLHWQDLVLDYTVMEQVEEIRTWLAHGHTLMNDWGLAKKVKPGYRAVFYGAPGTGKTLTAALLAQSTNREIYRVDLSMIVSKYIGETEKNLSKVFDIASYKDWILFFDEADALFGKRTEATSSNDRHANQQTGYLLQRIEDFPGTVILATNLKANMDEAFTRRFQAMIHFTMPNTEQRLALWQNAFDGICQLAPDVDLTMIAEKYELAGGAIINVLRQCALSVVTREDQQVTQADLLSGIRREFKKDNKTISLL